MTKFQTAAMLIVISALGACASLGFMQAISASPAGGGAYCDLQSAQPALRYFATPAALADWTRGRMLQVDTAVIGDGASVVLSMGRRPTAGYGVRFTGKGRLTEEGLMTLTVDWREPTPGLMQAQVLTGPCAIAAVTAGAKRVEVRDEKGELRAAADLRP